MATSTSTTQYGVARADGTVDWTVGDMNDLTYPGGRDAYRFQFEQQVKALGITPPEITFVKRTVTVEFSDPEPNEEDSTAGATDTAIPPELVATAAPTA